MCSSDLVRRLAANPLLLTIIALISYQNVRLPERRGELYRLAVEALAESWNRARSLGGQAIDLYLGDRRLDARFVVNVLGRVASWVHATRPGGLVEQPVLEARIAEAIREQEGVSEARAQELGHAFLDLVRRGSGLLQERGLGLYGFLHLTFEEYLAARAIADLDADPAAGLLEHWSDAAWREVVLLAVGASVPSQATRLLEALLSVRAEGDLSGKNVVLAGQALADVGREGVVGGIWQKTAGALVALIEGSEARSVPARTRADAGDVLGLFGDPRIGDDAWVEVPAGTFLMGTTPAEAAEIVKRYGKGWERWVKDEMPRRRLHLGSFRIGKCPVTNREFKRFIDAGGYGAREHWSDAGWKWLHRPAEEQKDLEPWRQRGGRTEPKFWQYPALGARRSNRPVVGVTWYEAQAYCAWLTRHLSSSGKLGPGEVVTLPSEAEWEKAARGDDGRWWPWGNEWDPRRANTREGEVGATTAVGLYPDGKSPCHALDMAGNVWEWTRSVYKPYPYKPDDGQEDPKSEEPKGLRGGAWNLNADYARSAFRYDNTPDLAGNDVGFRCVVVPHAALPG